MYNPYAIGKQIYLRHPTEADVEGKWHDWFSDEETAKIMVDRFWPNTKEAQLEFYKSLNITEKMVLGTAQFGMDYGIANINGKPKKKEVFGILDLAWEKLVMKNANSYKNCEFL